MPKQETDYPRSLRIRLSDEDVEQLRSTARTLGVTVSTFVRTSFREAIAIAAAKQPATEVPPIAFASEWVQREIERLIDEGIASRVELEEIAAVEWDHLLEEARVFDGFDRLPDDEQSAYREHDASKAWARALAQIEAHPTASVRQQAAEKLHRHWRRAMAERRAEYAQFGLPFGADLPDNGPRRTSSPIRLARSSEPLSSEPRQRTKPRPRARQTSARRAARAPASDDDPSPSDLVGPVRGERLGDEASGP